MMWEVLGELLSWCPASPLVPRHSFFARELTGNRTPQAPAGETCSTKGTAPRRACVADAHMPSRAVILSLSLTTDHKPPTYESRWGRIDSLVVSVLQSLTRHVAVVAPPLEWLLDSVRPKESAFVNRPSSRDDLQSASSTAATHC